MISGKNFERVLSVHIEADKVLDDVKKAALFKQSLEKGVKLGILRILIAAVRGLPLPYTGPRRR